MPNNASTFKNCFWPADSEKEFYLAYGSELTAILSAIQLKWPDVPLDKVRIDSEYIHTDAIGYDLYDPSDYTKFIRVSLDETVAVGAPVEAGTIIETLAGTKVVIKRPGVSELYTVMRNGEVKHPNCYAEDVMRALGHYLNAAEQKVIMLVEEKEQILEDHRVAIAKLAFSSE